MCSVPSACNRSRALTCSLIVRALCQLEPWTRVRMSTRKPGRRRVMPRELPAKKVLEEGRNAAGNRVKVAVSDIDGVLRGKYLHKDKFFSAAEGGFGFCDVVFGWDMNAQCSHNTTLTGWHKGFPDAVAKIDLGTFRTVPWDEGVPFFL